MCLQAIGETWFVPKNEIVKPIDAPSVDILLSTLVLIAEAMVGTSITLLIKGTVISGDLIPAKVYLQTLKDNLKNSHQEIQVPDEIYKSFDLVFETFEKSLPKNAEEALNKQIGVLHLKMFNLRIVMFGVMSHLMLSGSNLILLTDLFGGE